VTPRPCAHVSIARPQNSGPLSGIEPASSRQRDDATTRNVRCAPPTTRNTPAVNARGVAPVTKEPSGADHPIFLCRVDLPLVLALLANIEQGRADVVADQRAIRTADRTLDDERVSASVCHRETRAFLLRVTRGGPCHERGERVTGISGRAGNPTWECTQSPRAVGFPQNRCVISVRCNAGTDGDSTRSAPTGTSSKTVCNAEQLRWKFIEYSSGHELL
jgi:hypothetical protein